MPYALYERRGTLGFVTLNRPERLNAISGDLLAAFAYALQAAIADSEASVLVLSGAGRAFCSGDDLKEYGQQSASETSIRDHIGAIQNITRLMLGSDKPIVGAIHGYAVGGGFEWLLNCDLVVAADDLIAFFPEMSWGQFVTGGVTHLLPLAVGYQKTMELLLLGERQSAHTLERLGLVNFVVTRDRLHERATELAKNIATKSRFSVGRLKSLLTRDLGQNLWRAVDREEAITTEAFSKPDVGLRVSKFFERKNSGT
jgi:enoyl-CoA hydratase/carnithine racemase